MMLARFLVISLFLVSAANAQQLALTDLDSLGFERGQQQIFALVGAIDGWSGSISGETVEVYVFADNDFEVSPMLVNATQPGNFSGWVEMCRVENLLMLSKGETACVLLGGLAE